MKDLGTMLLNSSPFKEIVMGNTALVRAMVECNTRVVTSYPGSPTPEIAQGIKSIDRDERPFYFEFSTNEKVATEVAFGAAINGYLSTVFFKSVGLNVAADSFIQLAMMKLIGGLVIVLGDDPGANSSQNEQDNRHYAHMSYIPMLEPSNPTEVYNFYKSAVKLSQKLSMPVILRLTTHVCHALEAVQFQEWNRIKLEIDPKFNSSNGPYIPITTKVYPLKKNALDNLSKFLDSSNSLNFNKIIDHKNSEYGIITSGLPFLSLMDALEEVPNEIKKPDILKLGLVYPTPNELIIDFIKKHKNTKIIEELDNKLEKDIKALAYENGITNLITGKIDNIDWIGEYTADKVKNILIKTWPHLLPNTKIKPIDSKFEIPPNRPAQMCPGCGHRSAFYAIKKALSKNDITVADIGCHSLGFLPPYNMGEVLLCMGASPGIGAGLSLFNKNRKIVAFMGDSTFFHAALPAIINNIFNQHNLTMILMENGTTAMTGHQAHPASGENFNNPSQKIPIRNVLEGFGIKNIYEVDTYQQQKLIDLTKKAISDDTFSVVIAKHPCMLKFVREQRKKSNYSLKNVYVDQNVCQKINECIENFACPSFERDADGKITVNKELCIGDGSCIQTCPKKAIKK